MNHEPSQLVIDLAAVCGFAIGNRTAAANAIKQAKEALGIDRHTKSLTADDKAAIVQWHKERLSLSDDTQLDMMSNPASIEHNIGVGLFLGESPAINETPAIIEQAETTPPAVVETIADETSPALSEVEAALELINAPLSELEALRLENAKLQAKLEAIDHKAAPTYHINETVRIAFYIGDKRTVIALSGFYLNALMVATGIDKKGVPAWVQNSVNEWTAFDEKLNVTEQVKLLIVRELESQLIKARG